MSDRDQNVPQMLRERMARQRRRARLLRYSLAVSFAAALVLTLVYGQWQLAAPATRTVLLHQDGSTLWMVDQSLRVSGQAAVRGAGIRLLAIKDGALTTGPAFDGAAGGLSALAENRLGITTDTRLLVFDTAAEGWPRLEVRNLGLNDTAANPVVARAGGQPWLCWVRGPEILVQPLEIADAEPQLLFKTRSAGARLQALEAGDSIWLAVREVRSGQVTVLSFRPRVEKPADAPPRTAVILEAPTPAMTAGQFSFALLEEAGKPAVPVLAYTRKDDTSARWQLAYFTRTEGSNEGQWQDVDGPPRETRPTTLNALNFVSLSGHGSTLTAVYSDGSRVKRAEATGLNTPAWGEATELALDPAASLAG
ncbi:MAG: hypothetical protein IT463_02920, partial [Planctomycetes bacterium]|nr:hypothetical protein [Planctomycetota bacterium]